MKKPGKTKTNTKKQARIERKIPLGEAAAIADAIVEHLLPFCDKIDIVGSVRRCEAEVGDIDIVLRPMLVWSPSDKKDIRSPRWHEAMRSLGILDANSKNSKPMSQRRNVKIVLPWAGGTKVDIWIPQAHDYGRIMAIRTGNDNYARNVITGMWLRQQWVGTADGLRRRNECVQVGKIWKCTASRPVQPPPFPTEDSFFEYFNMKAIPPHLRKL